MTSPNTKYDLLLTGDILPGHKRDVVAAELAKLMRVSEAKALELLSGNEQVVKRDLGRVALQRYIDELRKAGADIRSEESVAGAVVNCPCCGKRALQQRGAGELCAICEWRDDPEQNESCPDKVLPGRNWGYSLAQAQKQYARGSLRYVPNTYLLRERVIGGLIVLLVIPYCGWSLWRGEMFLWAPSRFASLNVHSSTLLGSEVWLMSAGLLAAVSVVVLMIADHYDRRRNEHRYRKAGQVCSVLTWVFFGLALTLHSYRTDGLGVAVFIGVLMSVAVTMAFVHRKGFRL